MSNRELRLTVIEAATYCKRFDPLAYGEKYRKQLTAQAWKLVDDGLMRYWLQDNGDVIFTLE